MQGAVATKDFVPELQHFHIQGGMIRSYNGLIGLGGPIDLNLDICPKATELIKAIQVCKDTIQLHVTPSGKLAVKSGKFRAYIECIPHDFPEVLPEGAFVEVNGNIIKALKTLAPLIADDASRAWARGILFKNNSAFATNNIVLAEYWLGYSFPVEVNIPRAAVMELIRIGEEPIRLQMAENCITFHFTGGRWLRTQTHTTQWPDLSRILDNESVQKPFPPTFFNSLDDILPFTDDLGRLFLSTGKIGTCVEENLGASIEVDGIDNEGCFNIKQLQLLQKVATSIDFSTYPAPCLFFGENIRGAIVGIKS